MKTANTVEDGTKMDDEQLGRMTRRCDELKRRINAGTLSYKWVMDELQLVIEKRSDILRPWKVWKTIKLGAGLKTADDFRRVFKEGGFKIKDRANDILGEPDFETAISATEIEVDLVLISGAGLGFKGRTPRRNIFKRAREHGLELCSAEIGLHLRLQYPDQPIFEHITVAMEPIYRFTPLPAHDRLNLFGVVHDYHGKSLSCHRGSPDFLWDEFDLWVFRRLIVS